MKILEDPPYAWMFSEGCGDIAIFDAFLKHVAIYGAKTLTPWFSHQKTSLLMPIFLSRWELWRVENMMFRSTCGWLDSHFGTM
jgi:hypothetical protein